MSDRMEDFLQKKYLAFAQRRGRMVSAAEFAKHLGVSNTSLSQWMNGQRVPTGDNVHRLAAKLGSEVYVILGLPPMLPDDPGLRKIAQRWFALSDDAQQRIVDIIESEAQGDQVEGNPNDHRVRNQETGAA